MAYSIKLPDGTLVNNIPDEVTPEEAKNKILKIRPELATSTKAEPSAPFSLGNLGLGALSGFVGGIKGITNIAGANNPVSRTLGEAEQYLEESKTPERKAEIARRQKIEEEANKSGKVGDIASAYLGAIKEAPLETAANLIGGAAPFIFGGGESKAAQLGLKGLGLAMGAGSAKGAIYDSVYAASKKAGDSDEVAQAKAEKEQSYTEHPLGIATAAGLGLGSALGGAAQTANAAIRKRLGKEVADNAVGSYKAAAIKEGLAMGAQSGQQQALQNQALTQAGYQTPTGQGVLGAALTGGISGAAFGAGAKFLHPNPEAAPIPTNAPDIKSNAPPPPVDVKTASYADLHKELVGLNSQEQTPEIKTRAGLVADTIKEQDRQNIEQMRADQLKAQQSAFNQTEPQQIEMREAGAPQEQPVQQPVQKETQPIPEVNQAQRTLPGMGMPITEADIAATGVEHGPGVAKWLKSNVIGLTTDEVSALTKKDPKLLKEKGQRAQVLKAIINPAPEVPAFKEPTNVTTTNPQPTGESTPVVSKSSGAVPPEGTTGVKPSGVEPAQPTISQPNGGENAQPPALEQPPAPQPAAVKQPAAIEQPAVAPQPVKPITKPVAKLPTKTAEEIHAQREDIRDQQYKLLGPDSKIPKEGTPERAQWDKYENEHLQLTKDWASTHRAERRQTVETANKEARQTKPIVKKETTVENTPSAMDTMAKQLPKSKKDLKETTPKVKLDKEEVPRYTEGEKANKPLNAFEAAKAKVSPYTKTEIKTAEKNAETRRAKAKEQGETDIFAQMHAEKNPKQIGEKPNQVVEKTLIGHVAKGSVKDALQTIIGTPGNTYNGLDKLIAKRLLNLSSLPTVEVVPEGTLGKDKNGDTIAGMYNAGSDHIQINEGHVGGATLLHEIIHGVLHRLISSHLGGLTDHYAIRGLENVYNHVKNVAPELTKEYGMTNLSEFASEVMSNKIFQKELQKIPYQRQNAFTEFAKKVLQIIGLAPTAEHTALAAALIHAENAFHEGRKMQEAEKGMPIKGALGEKTNAVVPNSIDEGSKYLRPTTPSIRGAITSMVQGTKTAASSKPGELGTVTKVRTMVTDRLASVKNRIQDAYDKGMAAKIGPVDPIITAQQAKDADRMVQPFLEKGGIEVNPVTRQLEIKDYKEKAADVFPLLQDYAKDIGRNFEEAYSIASHILEGMRVAELIKQNATQGTEFIIHKGWRVNNDPKGAIDMVKVRDAEQAYSSSAQLKDMSKTMDAVRIRMVNELEKAGRLTSDDADIWRDASHYVPFDRIQDFADTFTSSKRTGRKGYAQLGSLPKLEGSAERPVGNIFENYFKTMGWMVDQLAKQNANTQMLDALIRLGIGKDLGRTDRMSQTGYVAPIYRKGEKFFVDLPSKYDVVPFIDKSAPKSWYISMFGKVAPITRKLVTTNPAFALNQVIEDVQGALLTSNIHNPLRFMAESLGNFGRLSWNEIKNYKGDLTGHTSKVHEMEKQMRMLGLAGEVDYTSYNPGESLMYDMNIRKRGPITSLIHRLEKITQSSDLAVRKAIYDDEFRKNNDALMSTKKARELINFRNAGASATLRDMISVVPFLNSTLQSMDILYRAATGTDAPSGLSKEAAKDMFKKNMMIYAGLTLVYAMAKSGDEEYEKMNRRMRDHNWILGDGMKVPIRGDMAIVKVAIENAVGYFNRQGTPEEQLASEAVKTAALYAWSQTGERLTAAPIPLAVRPLIEMITNHSFLTGRELEGTYQQQLLPHVREVSKTSEQSKIMANWAYDQFGLELSPIMMDQAFNGYFGAVPSVVNMITDHMLNPSAVDRPLSKWVGLSAYTYDETNLTNPTDEFYDLREKVIPKLKTLQDLAKTDPANAEKFYKQNEKDLQLAKPVEHALAQLSKMRAYEKALKGPQGAEIISNATERDRQLKELLKMKNDYLSWIREAETAVRNQ
jgi:hypothetical protein